MPEKTEKKNASDYIDNEMGDLIKYIMEEMPGGEEEGKNENEPASLKHTILTPKKVAQSVQPISRMMARKFDLASVELTDEDAKDLAEALEPFKDNLDKIITILPYVPLILFSIGYGARIWDEKSKKKKLKKKKIKRGQIVE